MARIVLFHLSLFATANGIIMENLPLYIPVVFIATTIFTLYFLYKASGNAMAVILVSVLWLVLQGLIGLSGFYTVTDTLPPRFSLLVLPPFLLILLCFVTPKGRSFIDRFDAKWLTLLHVVRIPVEIVLFWLFLQKYIPELMTFEGSNPDILSGLSAPLIFYFGYARKSLGRKVLLAWNVVCLLLLFNIVTISVLSAPAPFQQLAFEQPNTGVLHFPYLWLPGFIVPAVLFSHLVSLRHLQKHRMSSSPTNAIRSTSSIPTMP